MEEKPNQPPGGESPQPPGGGPTGQPPAGSPPPPVGGYPPPPPSYVPPPPPSYAPPPPPPSSSPPPPPSAPPPPSYAPPQAPGQFAPPPPPGGIGLPGGYAPMQAGMGGALGMRPAGFWIRFVAYLIDAIIVSIPLIVIGLLAGLAGGGSSGTGGNTTANPVAQGLGTLVSLAYFAYFWSRGRTPGMMAFNLRVIDADTGGVISLGRALLRYVGFFISALVCFIGLIWAAFDGRKQGWHDKIAKTLVVHGA